MSYQLGMFTAEQMTGSGQTNMVDLIHANEDTKRKLRTTPHHFYSDPAHGWLKVRVHFLKVLGIFGAITAFSYRAGDDVYLEEDYDAEMYINALFGKPESRSKEEQELFLAWRDRLIKHGRNGDHWIRNLPQFHKR